MSARHGIGGGPGNRSGDRERGCPGSNVRTTGQGRSPLREEAMTLYEAAGRGDLDAVRRLLDGGAEVDALNQYENTPLMEAASRGQAAIVRMLLEAGADPRRANSLALDFAVRLGNPDCVRLLLEAGADPNRSEPDEDDPGDPPPLFEAVQRNNLRMIEMLLDAGARVDVVVEGWGLLSVALRH